MSTTGGRRKSAREATNERAATRDTLPAIGLMVALQSSLLLLDPDGRASPRNILWSLLPLAPALWLVWTQLRGLRRADEFQRILQLEAMAIGFATMIMVSMTGGLLDGAGIGNTRQSLQATFIAGTLTWVAALVVKLRRAG
jgi:hypothetical protein